MSDVLAFVTPDETHREMVLAYMREHVAAGETILYGSSLLHQQPSYGAWLARLARNRAVQTALPGCVPAATRLVFRRADHRLVGIIDMRNALNDYLRKYGGHIGYGVRPSERGRGYATEMLRLALLQYKAWGISRVMVACDRTNPASAHVIRQNGGQLEREYTDPQDGSIGQVYWIAVCAEESNANPLADQMLGAHGTTAATAAQLINDFHRNH